MEGPLVDLVLLSLDLFGSIGEYATPFFPLFVYLQRYLHNRLIINFSNLGFSLSHIPLVLNVRFELYLLQGQFL
jgi:hypothetical protein